MGAFRRLQEEIMKNSIDRTLFAWTDATAPKHLEHGLLAESPIQFAASHDIVSGDYGESSPYSMTNKGLNIEMSLVPIGTSSPLYYGLINCTTADTRAPYAIMLKQDKNAREYRRVAIDRLYSVEERAKASSIFVPQVSPKLGVEPNLPTGDIFFIRSSKCSAGGLSSSVSYGRTIEWDDGCVPSEIARSATPNGFKLPRTKNEVCLKIAIGHIVTLRQSVGGKRYSTSHYKRDFTILIAPMHGAILGFDIAWLNYFPSGASITQPRAPGSLVLLKNQLYARVNVEKVNLRPDTVSGLLYNREIMCFAVDVEFGDRTEYLSFI